MGLSNYPPGHPTGSSFHTISVECPNGHSWVQHCEYERDVNAWNILDGDECPECGLEPTDYGQEVYEDEGPDPDLAYDMMRERELGI